MHDLDTCEVTVESEELNPEQESLEVDMARLQHKGIEVSRSDLGVVFTGERPLPSSQGPRVPGGRFLGSGKARALPASCPVLTGVEARLVSHPQEGDAPHTLGSLPQLESQ